MALLRLLLAIEEYVTVTYAVMSCSERVIASDDVVMCVYGGHVCGLYGNVASYENAVLWRQWCGRFSGLGLLAVLCWACLVCICERAGRSQWGPASVLASSEGKKWFVEKKASRRRKSWANVHAPKCFF